MPILLAKTAGFCFGVRRAVEMTEGLLRDGVPVVLLGELIHNRQVTGKLKAQGACVIDEPAEAKPGQTVVIRAHGVPREINAEIERLGLPCCDATCPFVRKIHRIVAAHSAPDVPLLVLGDPAHPEVIGIRSYAAGASATAQNAEELEFLLERNENWRDSPLLVVAQTTFHLDAWKKSIKKLNLLCTNVILFDTICSATQSRQEEARQLAASCDAMVVIGDRLSSNTAKLLSVCGELCPSYLVEGCDGILPLAEELQSFRTIGCTAGASTPARTIKEVLKTMSDLTNESIQEIETLPERSGAEAIADEMPAAEAAAPVEEALAAVEPAGEEDSFSAQLEESLKSMNSDQKVKGIVTAVNPSEIQVDIGRKQTGYVAVSEYSNDPNADPSKELKLGDVLDLIILKTNDAEGTVQLSKKRFDAGKAWMDIVRSQEEDVTVEGKIVEVIKGGVLAFANGARVFIPGSLTGLPRNMPLDGLLHETVRFRITEVDRQRRRAVGSIRAVQQEERKSAQEAFWSTAEVGQAFRGKVKSIMSYGAFVDIGGLDGMVHISELSWGRIKNPSEVIQVGDEIDVYVKALDPEKKKISLGYRKAEDNPWEILRQKHPVDSVVEAQIVSFTTFGAFARVLPGVDGLIHISQIANRRIEKPQDELKIGQTVQVKIVGVDFEKRRVSLSIRALLEDEPEQAAEGEADEVVASSSSED
ncbi:MAG: bifunctional 4-hydroxy-3-methylbut-2-enyl diphosphate reductase/30S ribosomal protein S1 [Oscillospiraceae bacterium]|nr:bifunctional 4-hydroxy-3-methylbut-2-enyl diphosphate reductase/30S ribosomal protein S1 [Oscillospiraceae bacterium]